MFTAHQQSSETIEDHFLECSNFQVKPSLLSGKKFTGKTRLLLNDQLILTYRESTGALSEQAIGSKDYIYLCFPSDNTKFYQNNYLHHRNSQVISFNDEFMHAIYPDSFRFYGCTIGLNTCKAILSDSDFEILMKKLSRKGPLTEIDYLMKSKILQHISLTLQSHLESDIHILTNKYVFDDYLTQFYLLIYTYLCQDRRSEVKIKSDRRMHLLRQCIDYIAQSDPFSISIAEMSKQVRSSQRNIQYAFNETLGVSAFEYIKIKRFNYVRAEIVKSGPTAHLAEIYRKFSIRNFGRFSLEYKNHFGEYPKDTKK